MQPHKLKVHALAVLIAGLVGVLAALQFWLNARLEGYIVSFPEVFLRNVLSWLTWGAVAPSILRSTKRWPVRGFSWKRGLMVQLLISVLFALVHRPLHVWFVWYPFWGGPQVGDFVRDYTFFSIFTDVSIYWLLIGCKTVYDQRESIRERDLRSVQLAGELAAAKLAFLEQQIRPHFLFNTLHAVQALQADGRIEESIQVVERLSTLLRAVMHSNAPQRISLREEFSLARNYLDLMAVRFADRLCVEVEADELALDSLTPRLILQPLLENALEHGVEGRTETSIVRLTARVDGSSIVIEIQDNGPGLPSAPREGLGLANVRARLIAQYGTKGSLELLSAEGGGALARLRLPREVALGELEVLA